VAVGGSPAAILARRLLRRTREKLLPMGTAYRCDRTLACTFGVLDGNVTPDDRNELETAVLQDPDFPPGRAILIDLRSMAGEEAFTSEVVSEIALKWRALAPSLPPMRIAFVASRAWEPANAYARELDDTSIRVIVFTDDIAAATWLGIDRGAARKAVGELRQQIRASSNHANE